MPSSKECGESTKNSQKQQLLLNPAQVHIDPGTERVAPSANPNATLVLRRPFFNFKVQILLVN